jgi:RNA polymerase sigma-70 factor (ECF subfamily)
MTTKEYNNSVDLYADPIYRFVLKHIKNAMLSQDVVQETFAKVWEKHQDISVEKAKSYLFTTAYHTLIDVIKKENKSATIDEKTVMPVTQSKENFDLQEILTEALDRLPEIQKSVIMLRDYEGYAYDEIAEITGLNESQVKVYIFRGRQTLKAYLKNMELVA